MKKPVIMWALVDPYRRVVHTTVRRTRHEAIAAWLDLWAVGRFKNWKVWYRRGYRVAKVEVREVEQ